MSRDDVARLTERMARIGLDELGAATLETRQDRKYVIGWDLATELVAGLTGTHRFLAIDGRTSSTYESVYCDSPSLDSFRAQSSSSC